MICFIPTIIKKLIVEFKNHMIKRYEMNDMGLLHHFLGTEIYQHDDGVFVWQRKYAENVLIKFGIFDYKPMSTPLVVNKKTCQGRRRKKS